MIKINSLLPNKSVQKEVAIQTDGLLPKILIPNKNNNICNQSIKHIGPHTHGEFNRNSKQAQYFHQKRQEACRNNLDLQNQGLKFRRDRKQNSRFSLESSKIQAKLFKFLKFEQNILKLAIVKYLEGKQLCKDEKKKIEQTIKLSFISTHKNQPSQLQPQYEPQYVVVQIPIYQEFSIPIKEIINGIRQTYLRMKSKKDHSLHNNSINKKIAHLSESFIYQVNNIKIHEPLILNWKRQEIVSNYLKKYVRQCQAKLGCNFDLKQRLITFYQDTYNKYELVPFNKQESGQISQIIINSNSPKDQTYLSNNSCINSGQSFIKLKFYNDLRKEVKKLGEDTDKIISDEMNKFNQE